MAEFGLIESFGIDGDELNGMTPQQVFVLGYELADISRRAEFSSEGWSQPVQSANADRIRRALGKRGREWRFVWPKDDRSESWVDLFVEAKR